MIIFGNHCSFALLLNMKYVSGVGLVHYFAPFCTSLHHFALLRTILHHFALLCTIFHYFAPFSTTLHHFVQFAPFCTLCTILHTLQATGYFMFNQDSGRAGWMQNKWSVTKPEPENGAMDYGQYLYDTISSFSLSLNMK